MTETRTLCLTDVVDSTKLAAALGEERNAALWDAHDALARALVARWRGTELERTDGIMVLFEAAADALSFAVAYHAAVRTLDPPLLARAGLHTGPLAVRPNPPEHVARGAKRLEVDGLGIAITARVMSVALGGQTLTTTRPETTLRTVSHGHWHLKGVPEPVELFEVGDEDAPFRPPPDAEKVYRVVQTDGVWLPVRAVPHLLPPQRDGFVGRSADLVALAAALDGGASVVTLFGPAGAGKSRLALAYAWSWLGEWPGGAWWCDLSAARSLDDVRSVVSGVVGALGSRGRCLVVLDRAEGVAPHLAEALAGWLDGAPRAAFVPTTREPLDLPGEVVLAVPPLARADAIALFVRRAEAANRDFRPAEADPATLASLVEVLERWPLPIEQAAARVRTLTPEALLAQLGADTRVLALVVGEVAGAPALKQALGDRAAAALLAEHQALVRTTLAGFPDGEEIESGAERTLAAFGRPSEAVRFAVTLRRRLAAWNAARAHPVHDRLAVHVGEVLVSARAGLRRADGTAARAVSGSPVDLVSRLGSWAEPGRVLVTRPVFDAARQQLGGAEVAGGELRWWAHGPYLLRDVVEPVEVCEIGEAGAVAPGPPAEGELARRHDPAAQVVTGWRPAVGLEVPGTRFALVRKLGEGAVGEVWLAVHGALKDHKVFKFCFQADRVRSLRREVTLFRVLRDRVGQHPNIAGVQEVSLDAPPFYLVVDFVDGPDLARWLTPATPLAERLEVVAQVADALQAAHEAGVVHRDVKPQNVLVGREGPAVRARLADFGIGQVLSEEALGHVTRMGFTQTLMTGPEGSISGTRLYLAPELLQGAPATPRSDLYALGVVLFQVLVGDVKRPLPVDWASQIDDPLLREDLALCFAGEATGQLARQLRSLPERRAEQERREEEARRRERRSLQRGVAGTGLGAVAVVAVVGALGWRAWQQQQVAEAQERLTAEALAENRGQLYRQYVAEGNRLEDDGRVAEALSLYAAALALATANHDAHREHLSRLRLSATVERLPRLEGLRASDLQYVWTAALSRDGEVVHASGFNGTTSWQVTSAWGGAETARRRDGGILLGTAPGGDATYTYDPSDGRVTVVDAATGAILATLAGRSDWTRCEHFVHPGRLDRVCPESFESFAAGTLDPLALRAPLLPGEGLRGLDAAGTVAVGLRRLPLELRLFSTAGEWSTPVPDDGTLRSVRLAPDARRAALRFTDHAQLVDPTTARAIGPAIRVGAEAVLGEWSGGGCAFLARASPGVRPYAADTGRPLAPWLPLDARGQAAADAACDRVVLVDPSASEWALRGVRAGSVLTVEGRRLVGAESTLDGERRFFISGGDRHTVPTAASAVQLADARSAPVGPLHPGVLFGWTADECCAFLRLPADHDREATAIVRLDDGAPIGVVPGEIVGCDAGHRCVFAHSGAPVGWTVRDVATGAILGTHAAVDALYEFHWVPGSDELVALDRAEASAARPLLRWRLGPGASDASAEPLPLGASPVGAEWGVQGDALWIACPEGLCRAPLTPGGPPLAPLRVPPGGQTFAVSPDGRWVVGHGGSSSVWVADATTGVAHPLPVDVDWRWIWFSEDRVGWRDLDGSLVVYDAATGERVAVRERPSADDLRVHPDDRVALPWLVADADAPLADWLDLAAVLSGVEVGPSGPRTLLVDERVQRFERLRSRRPGWVGPDPGPG